MNAVDTNVIIYAHDPRSPAKRSTAEALMRSMADGALMWQVVCEYLSASRKLDPFGYSRAEAWADIRDLERICELKVPTWDTVDRTEHFLSRFSLSYWDALLVAACPEGGVTRLYSEDITGYSKIDTLELVNPFATP